MPKKKSKAEIVYCIIKNMSQTDKRNFKLNNKSYSTNKVFLDLYDFLNGQKEFDAEALDDFFLKNKISQPRLSVKYLRLKLIDSLEDEAKNSFRIFNKDIEQHKRNCLVYLYSGLVDEAYTEITKAEKIAIKYEDFYELIKIYQLTAEVALENYKSKDFNETSKKIRGKIDASLSVIQDHLRLTDHMMDFFNNSKVTDPDYKIKVEYFDKFLERKEKLPLDTKQLALRGKAAACYFERDYMNMLDYLYKVVLLYESVPFDRWHLNQYVNAWNNILVISGSHPKLRDRYKQYMEKFLNLPLKLPTIFIKKNPSFKRNLLIIKCTVQLLVYIRWEEFDKIPAIEEEVNIILNSAEDLPSYTSSKYLICLRMALCHLILGDLEKPIIYMEKCSKIETEKGTPYEQNIDILNVLVLFEKGEFRYLKSLIRNLKRIWKKKIFKTPNSPIVLNFIQKAISKKDQKISVKTWEELHDEVYEAEKSKYMYQIKLSKWAKHKMKQAKII